MVQKITSKEFRLDDDGTTSMSVKRKVRVIVPTVTDYNSPVKKTTAIKTYEIVETPEIGIVILDIILQVQLKHKLILMRACLIRL